MREELKCNAICPYNDPIGGCVKPSGEICPGVSATDDCGGTEPTAIAEREKTIRILGEAWTVKERSEDEDDRLKDCDGYCDWTTREIVVEREVRGNLGDMEKYIRKVTRHEIVHAFLLESGLFECAGEAESWAANEEMVDWFARQGPKIYAAWREAGALDE